jgi:hypothetical protein
MIARRMCRIIVLLLICLCSADIGRAQVEPSLPRLTRVTVAVLGCREAPDRDAVLLGRLRHGTEATVVAISRPWAGLTGTGYEPCWVPMFDVRREVTVGISELVRERNARYLKTCPCGSGFTCTGERSGTFCMMSENRRNYQP